MKEYPMTFDEFTKRFTTEEQCRDYLYQLRFSEGFICPKCQNTKSWAVGKMLFECCACGHQTSVTAGTIFQDTRTPLKTWFTAIWWIATQKNGASAKGLQQILGLKKYETAWTWLHKIRKAMVFPNRTKLKGVVEIDETYIGGEENENKRGRGTENKALVAVAIELGSESDRKPGRVRMSVIPDASGSSLKAFVTSNIDKGGTVITDGWAGYSFLVSEGYQHTVYSRKHADIKDKLLPHAHMIISLLKRWLLGTHQGAVTRKHLQAYLDEYVFRFNRRKAAERGLLFYRLLECAMNVTPVTYDDLVRSRC